ncbi:MAG: hypothetical protein U5Q44_12935 [Dehalococcoidia bacterium]|nr:hypothetical protein [Dehalococcoidia bacterium]
MDIREMLIDGISQMNQWVDEALEPLTTEQINKLPEGKTTSIGFNAWHVRRTQDNITNFVCQGKMPVWVEQGLLRAVRAARGRPGHGREPRRRPGHRVVPRTSTGSGRLRQGGR